MEGTYFGMERNVDGMVVSVVNKFLKSFVFAYTCGLVPSINHS
jgi:hypothetical protein